MGKNQAYKAMQRSRVGSGSGGPEEVEDGMVDGSFHTPEWHAARLASLKTSHTVTWEEFKQKQKEDRLRSVDLENDAHKMMRDYRAQLDKERAQKLAHGRNRSSSSSSLGVEKKKKKKKRDDKKNKHSSSKRSSSKRSRRSNDDDDDDDSSDSDDSDTKRSKKKKRHRHKSSKEEGGPIPLSKFFHSVNT